MRTYCTTELLRNPDAFKKALAEVTKDFTDSVTTFKGVFVEARFTPSYSRPEPEDDDDLGELDAGKACSLEDGTCESCQ